jgi:phosphatidylserine/phosphatidylglycerophosphate/cardiolipin synthase-like enzyme
MSNSDSANRKPPASPWLDNIDLRMPNKVAPRGQAIEPALAGLVSPFLGGRLEGMTEVVSDHPVEPDSLAEHEFRLDRLPPKARGLFGQGSGAWREAVTEAATAGIRDPNELADLVFFMNHPERMSAGVGRLISRTDPDFVKLRAEWNEYRKTVTGILKSLPCTVFLAPNPSKNYEDYVAAPTTGRMALMINGRDSGGKGPHSDRVEAFDSMQAAVESLGSGDSLLLAAWMFDPSVPLTAISPAGLKTWGELLQSKAKQGVKIRIVMSDFDPVAAFLRDRVYGQSLPTLNKLIDGLTSSTRDNLKYIVSRHPATHFRIHVATHHQKFMIVKKGGVKSAFCGGLDIAYMRTPAYWTAPNYPWYWHDIHAKLDGLIVRDLENEFILRWNREKGTAVARSAHTGANAFEDLAQGPLSADDKKAQINTQKGQMLRTVSVQGTFPDIQSTKRNDIWQGYLGLIGCATRFIFMENQYFREPRMADAIVQQARARPKLMVIVVVPEQLDDPEDAIKLHGNWLQTVFFTRLFAGLGSRRLRVYTMFHRIIHSKLIFADDRLLCMGSANANPRGFSMDTELNIMVDDADTVKEFRHRLWAHELGIPQSTVAGWNAPDFFAKWDGVAKSNARLKKVPDEMTGEGVVPFDPKSVKAKELGIPPVLTET